MYGYRYTHKIPTYTHIYTFEKGFDTNPMNRVSGAPAYSYRTSKTRNVSHVAPPPVIVIYGMFLAV